MRGAAPLSILSHDMLGLRLDYTSTDWHLDAIVQRALSGKKGYCCVTNVHQCVLVHENKDFGSRVNAASFVLTDSVILQRARSIRYRVPFLQPKRGAQVMLDLCKLAAQHGIKIALIGGKNESSLRSLKANLQKQSPNLDVAYAFSPPFEEMSVAQNNSLVAKLNQSGARLIFVGLGCPKQENWMAEHTHRVDAMMIGVGAAFDFNAGIIKPFAPWVHRAGLEWLYRLMREPRRLWKRYLTTSPKFIWLLIIDAIKGPGSSE